MKRGAAGRSRGPRDDVSATPNAMDPRPFQTPL